MLSLQSILAQAEIDRAQFAIAIQTKTSEQIGTIQTRLSRWANGKPPAIESIEQDLAAIGWRLRPEPVPKETDLSRAKTRYLDLTAQMKTAKRFAVPMLRGKALKILGEIRECLASQCQPPDCEAIEWWVSCDLVGTIDWWWDYYRIQASRAQIQDSEGWAAIGKARYALAVIKQLAQARSRHFTKSPATEPELARSCFETQVQAVAAQTAAQTVANRAQSNAQFETVACPA